jgi:hypothetical protein
VIQRALKGIGILVKPLADVIEESRAIDEKLHILRARLQS